MMVDWLEEIDLGITGPPVSMGVRKLGDRPWLFTDKYTKDELALKVELSKKDKIIAANGKSLAEAKNECARANTEHKRTSELLLDREQVFLRHER